MADAEPVLAPGHPDALLRDLVALNLRAADLLQRVEAHQLVPLTAPLLAWEAACDQLLAERREWQRDAARLADRLADRRAHAGGMIVCETHHGEDRGMK